MKKYQEFKQSLQVEDAVGDVNKTTNKEKSGTSNDEAEKTGSDGKSKSSVKTKGNNDETKKVNSITKVNAKESYQGFKESLLNESGSTQKSAKKLADTLQTTWDETILELQPKSRKGYGDTKSGKQLNDAIHRAEKIAGSKEVSDDDKSWLAGYIYMISNPGKKK